MDGEPKPWLATNRRCPACPVCSPKWCFFGKHPPFLCCWSARSLFSFVRGSLKGHAANEQTCSVLLRLISEERTKSLAICARVITQHSLAGSQQAGRGCSAPGTDADFLLWGSAQLWQRGLRLLVLSGALWAQQRWARRLPAWALTLQSLSYFVSGFCSLKSKSLHPLLPQLNVDIVVSVWIANPFCVSW